MPTTNSLFLDMDWLSKYEAPTDCKIKLPKLAPSDSSCKRRQKKQSEVEINKLELKFWTMLALQVRYFLGHHIEVRGRTSGDHKRMAKAKGMLLTVAHKADERAKTVRRFQVPGSCTQ
ncbi:Uncharacterized protein Fot_37304 [Forsythia ovata]|uniref:Uncharacterized protein n=1 Tax=Forsythia ovata TaxID=205694 RepID=A0ABD1RYR1_9LAMI